MKTRRILLIVLLIFASVYSISRLWAHYRYRYDDLPFNRAVWIAQSGNHHDKNPRGKMADSVIHAQLRKGMTRQEVVQLLGEPDSSKSPDLYEYQIGNWGRCFLCPEVLAVHFDSSGKLISGKIDEH